MLSHVTGFVQGGLDTTEYFGAPVGISAATTAESQVYMLSPFAAMTASNFSVEFTNFDVLAATYFYFNVNGQAQTPVLLTAAITPINLSVAVPGLSKISIGFSSPGALIGGPVTTDVLVSFQLTQ